MSRRIARWTVIDGEDHTAWQAALGPFGGADVYFSAAYHAAYAAPGRARPILYTAVVNEALLAHAAMLRPIARVGAVEQRRHSHRIQAVL